MARFIWTPEAVTELQQLHEAGAGTTELAEALGTTPPTIRRKLAQLAADAGGDAEQLVGFAPAEAEAAQAEAPSVDDLPGVTTEDVNAALAVLEAPADEQPEDEGPTEEEAPAVEQAGSSEGQPAQANAEPDKQAKAPRARSRVDVTMEMLRREQGCTVAELAAAFADEFGDGKVSTAQQARYKVPAKFGLKAANLGKQDGREGSVYKLDE